MGPGYKALREAVATWIFRREGKYSSPAKTACACCTP